MHAHLFVIAAGPIHNHRFAACIQRHRIIRKQGFHGEAIGGQIPILPEFPRCPSKASKVYRTYAISKGQLLMPKSPCSGLYDGPSRIFPAASLLHCLMNER